MNTYFKKEKICFSIRFNLFRSQSFIFHSYSIDEILSQFGMKQANNEITHQFQWSSIQVLSRKTAQRSARAQ